MDEKLILNEITLLQKQNPGLRKLSTGLLQEQQQLRGQLELDWKKVR